MRKEARHAASKESGITRAVCRVPKITKVVLSMCVSQAVRNPKNFKYCSRGFKFNCRTESCYYKGEKKPSPISNFVKVCLIGATVTLEKRLRCGLFLIAWCILLCHKVRDFKGMSPKSFDGKGNYNMGLKEHIVFPEINYDKVESIRGNEYFNQYFSGKG